MYAKKRTIHEETDEATRLDSWSSEEGTSEPAARSTRSRRMGKEALEEIETARGLETTLGVEDLVDVGDLGSV